MRGGRNTITCAAHSVLAAALSHAVGSTAHLEHTEDAQTGISLLGQAERDKPVPT